MSAQDVGARVRASTPGWPALDGHTGSVEEVFDDAFPYAVRCDDGALRRYRAEELRPTHDAAES